MALGCPRGAAQYVEPFTGKRAVVPNVWQRKFSGNFRSPVAVGLTAVKWPRGLNPEENKSPGHDYAYMHATALTLHPYRRSGVTD